MMLRMSSSRKDCSFACCFALGHVLLDGGRPYNTRRRRRAIRNMVDLISREPIFRVHCEVADILDLGPAPFGHRRVVNLLGGTVTGAKLNGRVLTGGPDLQIMAAGGSLEIHERYTLESDAGALIQVDSRG